MQLSVFTSDTPLSKTFRRGQDGSIEKLAGGKLVRGFVKREAFLDLEGFSKFISGLNGVNALAYGVPAHPEARVLSRKETDSEKGGDLPVITRTRESFTWPQGEGVFMLDHDVRKDRSVILSQEELLDAITEACPALSSAPMLLTHSASSYIYEDGKLVQGQAGMRIYIRVKDATDIPRAGAALYKRLWLAGFGFIEIGGSGAMYERTLIDSSVWTPERLDFAGGANCEPPYSQCRPDHVLLNEDFDADAFDTRLIEDLTAQEEERYKNLVRNAKHQAKETSEQKRGEWLLSLPEDRRVLVETSLESETLPADFVLTGVNGEEFTVKEALADKEKYHGIYVQHPFEPDYQPDNEKLAQLKLDSNPRPCVHTFAHGGQNFWLDTAEAAFADVEAPEQTADPMEYPDPQKPLPRFKFLTRDEILAAPPLQWRVKGVIPSRGLAAMSGQSRAGKSFLVFDMACAIAEGRPWFGYRTKPCPIVYVCLEGEAGFKHRVEAWEKQNGRPMPTGITMIKEPFQIVDPTQVAGLAQDAPKNALIIVDTMSRSSAGVDENGPEGMGLIIKGGGDLQRLTEGVVLLVAHEGKDASKGLRGHSSLIAALDGHVVVTKDDDQCIWKIDKAKDGKDGAEHGFGLEVLELGLDEDGDKITSCVIHPTERPIKSRPKLTRAEQVGLDAFHAAMDDEFNGVRVDDWTKAFIKKHTGDNEDSKRRIFRRIRSVLVEKGYLDVNDDTYYLKNLEDLEIHSKDGDGW